MYKIQTEFNLIPYVMYDFNCSLPIFMKLTTQWHYVGISIHTFIQIAHEIPKNGKKFCSRSWATYNSLPIFKKLRLFDYFLQELPHRIS
jgi:hypothetical protein